MIVLSESSARLTPSPSAQDLKKMTDAASLVGCRVYYIPQDFTECETAENALAHVPDQIFRTPAVWIGYIPPPSTMPPSTMRHAQKISYFSTTPASI